ncbi:MAG: hypothetical protein K6G83_04560 [Lachnospiraceae bacterium]|nr:hypothetical protein [Lachnospiraceae bacterium]
MTVQQEAIRMINNMPDDTVVILVELLKRMMENDRHSGDLQTAGDVRVKSPRIKLGIADGMYSIPDNIDICNEEIAQMFGVYE